MFNVLFPPMPNVCYLGLTPKHSAAVKTRDDKLKSLAALLRGVVKGVQCHPDHGEDSPLYRAMGFVTFSERKTGLIRRPKAGSGPPAGNEEAAV